ncbi:ras-like gtp-binding protein rhol [Anaeramoeba ignava]|uniref:Ras-like gtp-binding protein rhol n=1 Tax=Anaeramoeba ignava TaxID=1746090 RepID=A0A9Q0LLC5_ANAIG|nr:ras-like gtp-binding protein rhol [Anaeramoeba ignava]
MDVYKILFIGSDSSQKTRFLTVYQTGNINPEYIPPFFENFIQTLEFNGKKQVFSYWDSNGQEDEDESKIRLLSYPGTNLFAFCYFIGDPSSFKLIETSFYPEAHKANPSAFSILIGLGKEERSKNHYKKLVSPKEALEAVVRMNFARYFECDLKDYKSIKNVILDLSNFICSQQKVNPSRDLEKKHEIKIDIKTNEKKKNQKTKSKSKSKSKTKTKTKTTDNKKNLSYKIVFVGDVESQKTKILYSIKTWKKTNDYIPSSVGNFNKELNIEGDKVICLFWDTSGQENLENLRILSYSQSDLIVFCYSRKNLETLKNIQNKWFPESQKFCPKAKSIIFGIEGKKKTENFPNQKVEEVSKSISAINSFVINKFDFENAFKAIEKTIKLI